jgi:IS1 family transposase/transposase-like protein
MITCKRQFDALEIAGCSNFSESGPRLGWRSASYKPPKGSGSAGWDRNPCSPLSLGFEPSCFDERIARPCGQLLSCFGRSLIAVCPLCIGQPNLYCIALALFGWLFRRTPFFGHAAIVVQKFMASTIDAPIKCTTIKIDAMILITCQHETTQRYGRTRNGNQRLRCVTCGKTFVVETAKPIGEMRIDLKDAVMALNLLLEGASIRAAQRLTGLDRNTICDLIRVVGQNCQRLLDAKVRGVEAKDVQLDEIWSFVGMKEKQRIAGGHCAEVGDSWTFIAIERTTKLVLAHKVGQRDYATCAAFLRQLNNATTGRFQLSSDGLNAYTLNVPFTFGSRVDFGQLIKTFGAVPNTVRYSPARITGAEKKPVFGRPDPEKICTSHVERLNLTLRMNLRRFTRLTNGHSKSLKHHRAMQALFFAWYNFCRKHEGLKGMTPAMANGLAEKRWIMGELLENASRI